MADETAAGGSSQGQRATVDRDACMGSGNCVYWAPSVFALDEDGIAYVCGEVAGHEEEVQLAKANCPTVAIDLVGEDR